jgi:HSP20 family protein
MTMRRLLNDLAAIEQHFAELTQGPKAFHDRQRGNWSPAVDIFETETDFVLTAEVPGVKSDEIDIQVAERMLILTGERRWEREAHSEHFHQLESAHGTFERKFSLSELIDVGKIQAELERGVLQVILPKRKGDESKTGLRKIEVKS